MDSIDIGLFDFDRHNALYYFVINADEQIYMRYGGRDAESATTYLNLRSLELALEEGLRMHERGEVPQTERPTPLFPSELALLSQRTLKNGTCVECHLIADYQNIQRELDEELDRLQHLYRSPDIKTIGIFLDVPAGLVVEETTGAAAAAGLQAGDSITHLGARRVRTFGDLQYQYDKVPRDQRQLSLGIMRDSTSHRLTVDLPERWWLTDLAYRHWTVEPLTFFKTQPLTAERKAELGLPTNGFAGKVVERDRFRIVATPALKTGDVIYGVNGVVEDELANTPELYIKLRHRAGDTLNLQVRRREELFVVELTTERQNFRKYSP